MSVSRQDPLRPPKLKLPTVRKPPSLPTGQRMYKPVPIEEQDTQTGPGQAPEAFIGPYNSQTEWMVYWAMARIFNNPADPRVPIDGIYPGGWPDWTYQKAWDGGRSSPGGSVIDFVVYNPGPGRFTMGLRIVTEYWHVYTNNAQQVIDAQQFTHLEQSFDMRDLWDQDFIKDPTGQAVIISCKNALGITERPNPLWMGTTLRGSRMDMIGGYY